MLATLPLLVSMLLQAWYLSGNEPAFKGIYYAPKQEKCCFCATQSEAYGAQGAAFGRG